MESRFIEGFVVGTLLALFVGALFTLAEVYVERSKKVAPIIVQCPDNTKQIVIPDASKMEL